MAARLSQAQGAADLTLSWKAGAVSPESVDHWLEEPVFDGGVTCETILKTHGIVLVVGADDDAPSISTRLRPIERLRPVGADMSRHVVYDFDLLSRLHYEKLSDARLDGLTYVVFDTETTGLLPEQGDEIVQIAAVRIVNGKRVKNEVFDLLVNPGRPIPPSSSAIHGVTDAMVADAVSVQEAVRQFHRFAEGAVLVAHNAPFDMEFLTRREKEVGLRFMNPILDTVLVSAAANGAPSSSSSTKSSPLPEVCRWGDDLRPSSTASRAGCRGGASCSSCRRRPPRTIRRRRG